MLGRSRSSGAASARMSPALIFCLCTVFFSTKIARGADLPKLAEVISKIAANEALFSDLDLRVDRQYDLVKQDPTLRGSLVRSQQTTVRCVYQEGLIFASAHTTGVTVDGTPVRHVQLGGFDGTDTRTVSDGRSSTRAGYQPFFGQVLPHTVLFGRSGIGNFRLSKQLVQAKTQRGSDLKVIVDGTEAIGDLACVRLRCDMARRGRPESYRLVWLATDRNFLPVKVASYALSDRGAFLVEEAEARELTEVEPGIWCPKAYEIRVNQRTAEGETILSNRTTGRVTMADRHPMCPISLFRDLEAPGGAGLREADLQNKARGAEESETTLPVPEVESGRP